MSTFGALLAWSFLFPLPTLLLSAAGMPRRAGALSFLAPLSIFLVALGWLAGPLFGATHDPTLVRFDGWVPFLPDSSFRLTVDALSAVMLLVVGGVATCVYLYAMGYMAHDERQHRFFAFLDFFVAAMALLVLAGNLSVLLVGWTGVGIASFLLISFWWQRGEPLQAGFLALGANAIGDAALLVAAVLVPAGAGELTKLDEIAGGVPGGAGTLAWLLVIAACAKSAQGPLWWWLPAAMAGPTPVSALIHAATMVAAGVYLLVRTAPLLALDDVVSYNVALIGLVTAIGGGLASLWQSNFKRGLAYSTVSQLGWMFAAVGVGAPFAALFHLITHASFKAMLFLGAGTVIAATHHEEEIGRLGGLRKKLPAAHAFFVLGTLALIGAPVITAGSFSKDAIIEGALHSQWGFLGWILLGSVVLTGAYAGRLLFGVFYGPEGESSKDAHAPGTLFTLPLVPLALGAVFLGWIEAGTHGLSRLLGGTVAAGEPVHVFSLLGLGAFGLGALGVGLGWLIAQTRTKCLPAPPRRLTDALLGEVRALPEGIAAVHAGRVSRYALIGLLGSALVVFLAQRPGSAAAAPAPAAPVARAEDAPPAEGKPLSPVGPRDGKEEERAKRAAATARMRELLKKRGVKLNTGSIIKREAGEAAPEEQPDPPPPPRREAP
jgi:NADH-quinone oxidoreductase subunit L